MADIRCLICNRMNDANADRCWYCRSPLPGKHTVPGQSAHPEDSPMPIEPEGPIDGNHPVQDAAQAEPAEEVPEWLARIRKLKVQDEAASPPEPVGLPQDGEVPAWLANLRENPQDKFDESASPKALIEDFDYEGRITASATGDQPEGEVQPMEPSVGIQYVEASQSPDLDGRAAENPPVAGEIPPGEPDLPLTNAQSVDPDFPLEIDDLPGWLSSETDVLNKITSKDHETEAQVPEQGVERLEKGMLPPWLKAMRPLDVLSPRVPGREPPTFTEEEGVLAGITGTLRSLDLDDRDIKRSSNSQELGVTASQQKNAELLYNMLHPAAPETTTSPGETEKKARKNLLRVVVSVILLLSVLLPLAVRGLPAVVPVLYPKEVVDTLAFLQEISSDKPVLLVAQFEAGLAGELAWTSEPVIEHLVSRGIPVALISTNVSGYAILEEQVQRAAANASGYPYDEKVINLGYLPGGTIGLISLVSNARDAMPFSTDLSPAWESTAIENVAEFSDFGALVLLTDNPEIVRAWVEQSGRSELPPPLIAVVSAQAAPLVQPYHESGQIRGYIAGAAGALSYQLIRQVPGKASVTFGAYQMALLTTALLVFVGGLVSLASSSNAEMRKKEGS